MFVSNQAMSLVTAITVRYCEGRNILPGISNGSRTGYIALFGHPLVTLGHLIAHLESVMCPISIGSEWYFR